MSINQELKQAEAAVMFIEALQSVSDCMKALGLTREEALERIKTCLAICWDES